MNKKTANRDRPAKIALLMLGLALIVTALLSLASGATDSSAFAVGYAYFTGQQGSLSLVERVVITDIRAPRTLLGILIGASLAVSGAIMQGLFRNPLADPGIVGVQAGAGLGAVTFIVLGTSILSPVSAFLGIYHVPFAAFLGGLATTFLLYRLSTSNGVTSVATMLLAGIALSAMAGAITGLLVFVADDQQLRDLTFWGLGSLAGATWTKVAVTAPIILPITVLAPMLARGLNAMALGEANAGHLGVQIQPFKRVAIIAVAAATGASVAASGGIGFVGIVVPHLIRISIGPDHRYLLPASALAGAIMLLLADAIARQIVSPAELPIGIVTAFIGAPFFLGILLRRRSLLDI
ncbi:MAG: iron ABC transporter permease [Pseudomonadota bacterium]